MELPEWIATIVGRLTLENAALLQEIQRLNTLIVVPPSDALLDK